MIGRIVFGIVVNGLVLGVLFPGLNYLRFKSLSATDFAGCSPVDPGSLQHCVSQVIFSHLADTRWVAGQFSIYVMVAALLTFFILRRGPQVPVLEGIAIAIGAVALLLTAVEPGRLVAISAFVGIMLGSLIVHSRQKPTIRINEQAGR